jgi:hypothetical protein
MSGNNVTRPANPSSSTIQILQETQGIKQERCYIALLEDGNFVRETHNRTDHRPRSKKKKAKMVRRTALVHVHKQRALAVSHNGSINTSEIQDVL